MIETKFEVVGTPKSGSREKILGRFAEREAAISHALRVRMKNWDDVHVRPVKVTTRRRTILKPPRTPLVVVQKNGSTYVHDADGHRIAVLVGPKQQRDHVANMLRNLKEDVSHERQSAGQLGDAAAGEAGGRGA